MDSQTEIVQSQADDQDSLVKPHLNPERKDRGKTQMIHVRTRKDKREIKLNKHVQPVSDDDELSEFSNFLGTTARQYVSLTNISWHVVPDKEILWEYGTDKYIISDDGKEWVMRAMRDACRVYKCCIKKKHFTAYDNDDERIKNKPDDIPLEDFKVLLMYWADEQLQWPKKNLQIEADGIVRTCILLAQRVLPKSQLRCL
ncbi:hypothetical protein OROGR_010866 [Orobanche gracilis]